MIIDIIEMPFLGNSLSSYEAYIPISLTSSSNIDDVYIIGCKTNLNIHKHFTRYKIIESLGGLIIEHIVLSDKLLSKNDANIYFITSRIHKNDGIETFRYFKSLESLLQQMETSCNWAGMQTIHQVALSILSTMCNYNIYGKKVNDILNNFISENYVAINNLTTASLNEVVYVMNNIQSVFDNLIFYSLSNPTENEIFEYLSDVLCIPYNIPSGSIGELVYKNKFYNIKKSDLNTYISKHEFGKYKNFIPQKPLININDIDMVNIHVNSESKNIFDYQTLLEELNNLELNNYTDLSLCLKYNNSNIPDIQINYSGSIFNNFNINTRNNITDINTFNLYININLYELYMALKQLYGFEKFKTDKPDIHICKTFYEDVYIKFISKNNKEFNCYFDLTIMSILAPVLIDNTCDIYIRNQLLIQ
jgi:hypothetical protein